MYKIRGADEKEYGPVAAEQLRQWIAEGRANAQTKILLEGTTDWRSLSEFPEFSVSAPGVTPSLTGFAAPGNVASEQVNGPAVGLMVVAILGFVLQAISLVMNLVGASFWAMQQSNQALVNQPFANLFFSSTLGIVTGIVGLLVSGFIFYGALKMKKLESHGLAMTASILAMVPCISPCCLIGLPFGIWALVVLSKPEVKNAFH
jgi:hypothetical protein